MRSARWPYNGARRDELAANARKRRRAARSPLDHASSTYRRRVAADGRDRRNRTDRRSPRPPCQHDRGMDLIADLEARGLIHDSHRPRVPPARRGSPRRPVGIYFGFDPTADSLHAGHLVGQLFLRRFQLAGHRPFPLAGGATGMIGDPGGGRRSATCSTRPRSPQRGRASRRQLSGIARLRARPAPGDARQQRRLDRAVACSSSCRDVGKHVTVNQMLAKESVRAASRASTGSRSPSSATCCCRPTTSATLRAPRRARCRSAAPTSGATSSPAST